MKCPKCGGECERDEVDNGVGMQPVGPWGCPECHWVEEPVDIQGLCDAIGAVLINPDVHAQLKSLKGETASLCGAAGPLIDDLTKVTCNECLRRLRTQYCYTWCWIKGSACSRSQVCRFLRKDKE